MYNLGELSRIIKAELLGDPAAVVSRARPFEAAEEGDITFAASPAYRGRVAQSRATAIIIDPPIEACARNLLVTDKPKLAFARAVQALHGKPYEPAGVSEDFRAGEGTTLGRELSIYPRATVGRDCVIGDRVTLHSGAVVGNRCKVGDDSVIHPNVTVYDDSEIGRNVVIHAGTVIGSDGFGFVADEEGGQVKLLQLGKVVIEDDCEIGANCAIDRGGFGETIIRRGVKLDNLIQVGHNTEIGEHTVVAALAGFSGGTHIGRRCVIAGQIGTNQHITIGDGAIITARTGVTKSVPPGRVMGGMMPAQDHNAWRRAHALYQKLPEIAQRLRSVEKAIASREAGEPGEGGEP